MNKHIQGLISYLSGHAAEENARAFLEVKGYTFIAQNVRVGKGTGASELDLIMKDKKTLVFIEVKKRQLLAQAAESITPLAQKRLYKGAQAFLAKHPQFQNMDCRFDVVLITPNQEPIVLQNVIED